MSNYNNLSLTYAINSFHGAPINDAGSPEISFGITFAHHLDKKSTLSGSIAMIDGYYLNTTSGVNLNKYKIFRELKVFDETIITVYEKK